MESVGQLSDFVERPSVTVQTGELERLFRSRTVLLTGAGGSIGSELSKQLADIRPKQLVLADMSEQNLYQLEQDLLRMYPSGSISFSLTDLRNQVATERLFYRYQPDIVIHAAAYKHVPMMERHPAVAFENNTLTTRRLVDLSEAHGVERFIFVSTDKAVEPTSVLGATKQFSEWYVRAGTASMRRSVVRFGNVFGSKGSVVPHFERCLQRGEPLCVTHPDMERYFMSVQGACALILETLLLGGYPTFLLQMGAPIRIEWLARQIIQRFFPEDNPSDWIRYTGPRPGEKLHERLTSTEEGLRAVDHPNIVGVDGSPTWSRADLCQMFDRIYAHLQDPTASEESLRRAVLALSNTADRTQTGRSIAGDGSTSASSTGDDAASPSTVLPEISSNGS
jgi:FlaA1/EpsC-like NDP-sugar epimerase